MRDLKNQAEDIDLLIERMDSQIVELAKAYRRELEEIEVFLYTKFISAVYWPFAWVCQLYHKVQKFSSGTGSPRWSRKKGRKTVVFVVWWYVYLDNFCDFVNVMGTDVT